MSGEPSRAGGQVIERNVRRERISIVELAAQAREHNISDLDTIRYAVLETSGSITASGGLTKEAAPPGGVGA